jgi:hypothetical protein
MINQESFNQIHELIEENIPTCAEAIPRIEEEFKKCIHPPSFIYRLNRSILKIKILIKQNSNLRSCNDLMDSLNIPSQETKSIS